MKRVSGSTDTVCETLCLCVQAMFLDYEESEGFN